jgi:hypothetical protein
MYPRPVPSHLRDPNKPKPGLTGSSLTHWVNNATKALDNYYLQQDFPPFYIPLPCYNVVHIHRFVDVHILDIIIQHFRSCRLYSIDTESSGRSSNVSLIQIHTIPSVLPSYLLLVQLHHLPPINSLLFTKIQLIFQLLFSISNILYGWGNLKVELGHALKYSLFTFPMEARCVDLQLEFRKWYTLAPPFCEACEPDNNYHHIITKGSSMFCRCKNHVYTDPGTLWSLQKGILYSTSCFLDKSQTENPWHLILDPQHTTLSLDKAEQMIYYAVYDCLSVTYLHLPVTQSWPLVTIKNTPITRLLTLSILTYSCVLYEHEKK